MNFVDAHLIKPHLLRSLERYWPKNHGLISELPINSSQDGAIHQHLKLVSISLPSWGDSCGINGRILVPVEATTDGENWQRVNWWLAVFLMLESWHERRWEEVHGPIHSFSFKLQNWDTRVWEHAWVNRIALFLRSWAAQLAGKDSTELFGKVPAAKIIITHDVDAIKKTMAIRLKQSAFNLYNALHLTLKRDFRGAQNKFKAFFKFALSNDDWWTLDWLLELEKKEGIKAHFNFYADSRRKTIKRWLMDPSYSLDSEKMQRLFKAIVQTNATIGLHPTYDAWDSSPLLMKQKSNLEAHAGHSVTTCRQHWLRFSWDKTWSAQSAAGMKHDTTLMFNDRPGFRASAALSWQPWNAGQLTAVNELPTVLMDSQFYDYKEFDTPERQASLKHWIDEVKAVGGEVAVLWHPHTLTKDYGWQDGFVALLQAIKGK